MDVAGSRTWLRTELDDYWQQREALASVLRYFAAIDMDHWHEDATAARIVSGAVGKTTMSEFQVSSLITVHDS